MSSKMQLAKNSSFHGDSSEIVPILSAPLIAEDSQESNLYEIKTVDGDTSVLTDDDAEENSSLVDPDEPQCRICFDSEGEDLIAPCHCKGTQKYIHRSCLDNWRSTKEGFAFAHCTECRARFLLRPNIPSNRWWRRLKFHFLVARDHAFIFIMVQLIVASIGMLVYKFYGEELREMFGYQQHPYGFYFMAALVIILLGLLYGFFITIICGHKIIERHTHILVKTEMIKEYVVEDRGSNDVPELDPTMVSELKELDLY